MTAGLEFAKNGLTHSATDTWDLLGHSVLIFNAIRAHGQQSVRHLAERIGLSKSSVHRHLQAIKRRECYPSRRCGKQR